ncbi:MAG: DNA-binding response regulator [Anaerolinea sp.]|nr:DNA-binding response regulator [Anaerolinea sp.]
MIRVMLVDDHRVVRSGLEQLLASDAEFSVVASVGDGAQALACLDESQPDVVLMDLSMPVMGGVEATTAVLARRPEIRVVVLTSFSDRTRILEALRAGAAGYLFKDSEPDEILRAVRAAARGGSPLAPLAARELLGEFFQRTRASNTISGREREVLTLVAKGLQNKQIARALGISEKTVKAHLTSTFQRIGVEDRTQAALWAERHGLTSA